MSQAVTHFFSFPNRAAAYAALAPISVTWAGQSRCPVNTDPASGAQIFAADFVDAGGQGDPGIPIMDNTQNPPVLKAGYFLNMMLDAPNTALPGLTGAGYWDRVATAWNTIYGTAPAAAPQREFAA